MVRDYRFLQMSLLTHKAVLTDEYLCGCSFKEAIYLLLLYVRRVWDARSNITLPSVPVLCTVVYGVCLLESIFMKKSVFVSLRAVPNRNFFIVSDSKSLNIRGILLTCHFYPIDLFWKWRHDFFGDRLQIWSRS
jgi:hypothetical protein